MTSIRILESERTVELVFAGDKVRLAGQVDYPASPPPLNGYPLVFILHHAGGNTREDYQHYADVALKSEYAVFRWDKRGTGRSGAGGRGSTTQDAVNAYEIALEQLDVNRNRVIIVAQSHGTLLLGSSFGLFARVQHPYAVVLVSNKLDEKAVLAIDTKIRILNGEADWMPYKQYATAACKAHNAAYKYGASYFVAPNADNLLLNTNNNAFHEEGLHVLQDWLNALCPISASI